MQGPYTKTVGLIVPSSDVNIEATYHRFAPPDRQRKTCATPNRTS